jgi:hypothetical protein
MNIESATPFPECVEGPEAFKRFDATMGALLSVPRTTLKRREKTYRKKVDANPTRRGPKRKVTPSASPGPAA